MATYTVSSTKSYMQAMQPMIEALDRLDINRKSEKVPTIDNEKQR